MVTIYEYLGHKANINDDWKYSGLSSVRVTELCERDHEGETIYICKSRDIHRSELTAWARTPGATNYQVRVIWIPRIVRAQIFDVAEDIFKLIHTEVGHDSARHVCSTVLAGVGAVDTGSSGSLSWYLSLHPKISMTWSQCKSSGGITLICVAEDQKLRVLEDLLDQAFVQRIRTHPTLPLLMAATLFSTEIDKTQDAVKQRVRQVEVRTGHHDWQSRTERPALGDLIGLAAKMSGCGTRIGSCTRKQSALTEILTFIEELCKIDSISSIKQAGSLPAQIILDTVRILNARATAQQIDTNFIKHRIQIQLDALYHLVAQNDALSAQEMAQDCRLLASASLRDSSSMKVIAIVTMFFLPGTFISSLLSIPLFDWDADSSENKYRSQHWRPVLVTFSAATFPLMVLTFGIWGFWMLSQQVAERKRTVLVRAQLSQQIQEDEVRILASKRRSLLETPKQ